MSGSDCIYRRTAAGQSAWDSGAPLAAPLLRVLGLIEAEMHSNVLRRLLRHHAESLVADWLSQLQKLGLVEALPSHLEHDLDFTGSFELRK
jgi:hypothetical protein